MPRSAWFSASTWMLAERWRFSIDSAGIAEHVDQPRIVDLQDESGLDDAEVLLAHRLGDGVEVLLVVLVVLVLPEAAGAAGGHEDVGDIEPFACRLEVLDVDLQQLLPGVRDGALGDDPAQRADGRRVLLEVLGVVLGEHVELGLPRRRQLRRRRVDLEAAEAILDVAEEADLAHLAVGDDVDARLDLLLDAILDRSGDLAVERFGVVRAVVLALLHDVEQRMRPGQAADVRRENAVRALLHGSPSEIVSTMDCFIAAASSGNLRSPVANVLAAHVDVRHRAHVAGTRNAATRVAR